MKKIKNEINENENMIYPNSLDIRQCFTAIIAYIKKEDISSII